MNNDEKLVKDYAKYMKWVDNDLDAVGCAKFLSNTLMEYMSTHTPPKVKELEMLLGIASEVFRSVLGINDIVGVQTVLRDNMDRDKEKVYALRCIKKKGQMDLDIETFKPNFSSMVIKQQIPNGYSYMPKDLQGEVKDLITYELACGIYRKVSDVVCDMAHDSNSYTYDQKDSKSMDRLQSRIEKLVDDIVIDIHRPSNNYFAVMSPNMHAVLSFLPGYIKFPTNGYVIAPAGMSQGTLNVKERTLNVHRDSFADSEYLLLGYKGPRSVDTGVVLALDSLFHDDAGMLGVKFDVVTKATNTNLYYRKINCKTV